jgi:hypothetical protein
MQLRRNVIAGSPNAMNERGAERGIGRLDQLKRLEKAFVAAVRLHMPVPVAVSERS